MSADKILVSWVSYGNDPFERDKKGRYLPDLIPGPTLELLAHERSAYRGKIDRAFFFVRDSQEPADRENRQVHALEVEVAEELRQALHERLPHLTVEICRWRTVLPPTHHEAIFRFTVEQLRRIRARHPEVPVLLSSGFARDERLGELLALPGVAFLEKPWRPSELVDAVERLLG